MKFNLINWALETVSTILVIIIPGEIIIIVYILINSCGTPLVYFMGIEENRQATKRLLMSKIRIVQKANNVKNENEMEMEIDRESQMITSSQSGGIN